MVLHRGAMLKRIYDWCIDAAHKPYALWIMGAVAFAESSFFPIPPDVMLIPMSLARPQRAWLYALVCTATSVVGGVLGYAIGALLYDSVGHWLFAFYGSARCHGGSIRQPDRAGEGACCDRGRGDGDVADRCRRRVAASRVSATLAWRPGAGPAGRASARWAAISRAGARRESGPDRRNR